MSLHYLVKYIWAACLCISVDVVYLRWASINEVRLSVASHGDCVLSAGEKVTPDWPDWPQGSDGQWQLDEYQCRVTQKKNKTSRSRWWNTLSSFVYSAVGDRELRNSSRGSLGVSWETCCYTERQANAWSAGFIVLFTGLNSILCWPPSAQDPLFPAGLPVHLATSSCASVSASDDRCARVYKLYLVTYLLTYCVHLSFAFRRSGERERFVIR